MTQASRFLEELLGELLPIVTKASYAIMEVYNRDKQVEVQTKADHSPLTEADLNSHAILAKGLAEISDYPVLSEEGDEIDFKVRQNWARYWLIDPLDGTKEFVAGRPEFTINVALIDNNEPILGVVHIPALNICYYAAEGFGAWRLDNKNYLSNIKTRDFEFNNACITVSHRQASPALKQLIAGIQPVETLYYGSALKFCLVAEGRADIYPCLAPTSEWDSAAGQCVVKEAGGNVFNLQGKILQYNTKDSLLNPHFYVVGDLKQHWQKYF